MDKELKAKWLDALRGGKYSQCGGQLRSETQGGFCCLGVLLDVSGRGEWVHNAYEIDGGPFLEGELDGYAHHLGLTNDQEITLIHMNDGKNEWADKPQSFAEIADWIEANVAESAV